jgi:hypothetical protein
MAAADDMRRIVRRASWRPEAVLRRLWARMRASWWHGWGLMARLRRRAASRCRQALRTLTIGLNLKTAVGSDLRGGFVGVHNPCEQLTPAQGVAADRVGVPSGSV